MQHPDYPDIELKLPLWVHDPDQTYDFFYIAKMTDFFLTNPDFFYQMPLDFISEGYKSYSFKILFDRATYDDYKWCEDYDVKWYEAFKKYSGSDAYRDFVFLPNSLRLEKDPLIFPDDFNFIPNNKKYKITIPVGTNNVIFTWYEKHPFDTFSGEMTINKIVQIVSQKNAPRFYKLHFDKMLYGSLVISCNDISVKENIENIINGNPKYSYFLYSNLDDFLDILISKIDQYYGNSLHKIPENIEYKKHYGYKVTSGVSQDSLPERILIWNSPLLDEITIRNKLINYGYFSNPRNPDLFYYSDEFILHQTPLGYYKPYNENQLPSVGIFTLQHWFTKEPLLTSIVWETVPQDYKGHCLLFCFPLSESLKKYRIASSEDYSSGTIYYFENWFDFFPRANNLSQKKIAWFFALFDQYYQFISGSQNTNNADMYIRSDTAYDENGNPRPNNQTLWSYHSNTISTEVPNSPIFKTHSNIIDDFYESQYTENIFYEKPHLCFGVKGNQNLTLIDGYATTFMDNGGAIDIDRFRLHLLYWNWDNLMKNSQGNSQEQWDYSLTDDIIWQVTLNPWDVSAVDEDFEFFIEGTLVFSNLQSVNDWELLPMDTEQDFYNYWENNIMTDSDRIKKIYAALQAEKYSTYVDGNGETQDAVFTLGDRIFYGTEVQGINYDLDGSIRSVKQRESIEFDQNNQINIPVNTAVGQWVITTGSNGDPLISTVYRPRSRSLNEASLNEENTEFFNPDQAYTLDPFVICYNIQQFHECFIDNLNKCFNLEEISATVIPNASEPAKLGQLPNNQPYYSIVQGLGQMIAESLNLSGNISETVLNSSIDTLIIKMIQIELLKAIGTPIELGELPYRYNEEMLRIPYPVMAKDSPTIFKQFQWVLSNLGSILGNSIQNVEIALENQPNEENDPFDIYQNISLEPFYDQIPFYAQLNNEITIYIRNWD